MTDKDATDTPPQPAAVGGQVDQAVRPVSEASVLADLKAAAARKWQGDPACQQAGLFARAAAEIERLSEETESARKDAARLRDWLAGSDALNAARESELKAAQEADELRAALLDCARRCEALKRPCGIDPESSQAMRNGEYMCISLAARAALGPNVAGNLTLKAAGRKGSG